MAAIAIIRRLMSFPGAATNGKSCPSNNPAFFKAIQMNPYERREHAIVVAVENGNFKLAATTLRGRHSDPAGFRYTKRRHRLLQKMGMGHLCARFYPVNVRGENRATLLMLNAMQGNIEDVALLLYRGADPELRDADGKSALDYAQQYQQAAIIELLQLWQKIHLAKHPLPSTTQHLPWFLQKLLGMTNE